MAEIVTEGATMKSYRKVIEVNIPARMAFLNITDQGTPLSNRVGTMLSNDNLKGEHNADRPKHTNGNDCCTIYRNAIWNDLSNCTQ
jgi:hypothetical protein